MVQTRDENQEATILVVDDDPVNRKLVALGLRSAEWQVHEVEDGLAAKEWMLDHPVDVVITDVMMPRMDGLSLIRWAKDQYPDVVWIILSGLDTFDAAVEAIHLGAFDFLAKPPIVKKLDISVRNALRHQRLLAEKKALHQALERRVGQLEKMCEILEEQAGQIDQDLGRARVIQNALLPPRPPDLPGFSINALYRPGYRVGGDLYDVAPIDHQTVAIYIADASGHGVSAAMLSVLFKQRLIIADAASGLPLSPARALDSINRSLFQDVAAPGMFVTAAYCLLDTREGELRVASAGHPPIELVRASGENVSVEHTGPALGLYPEAEFQAVQLTLEPGDRLFLYTDGLIESCGTALERERLVEKLRDGDLSAADRLRDLLREAWEPENRERDDVTMVLVEARDGPSVFDNWIASTSETIARPATAQGDESLLYGESERSTCIAVRGRGTYMQSDSFHDAVCSVLDAKRDLTLDLSDCVYLDSTFLGIIHDAVDKADTAGVDLRIRGVLPEILKLFEELSMNLVIRHTGDAGGSLPAEMRPLGRSRARSRIGKGILRAHETLASLSEENRNKFRDVVESLRAELNEP